MSRLQEILVEAKKGMDPWESIPESKYIDIAAQCREQEIIELRERILNLEKELEEVEIWDGDTQDDIHKAKVFFNKLIELAEK